MTRSTLLLLLSLAISSMAVDYSPHFELPRPGDSFAKSYESHPFVMYSLRNNEKVPYTLTFGPKNVGSGVTGAGSTSGSFYIPADLPSGTYNLVLTAKNSAGGVVYTATQAYSYTATTASFQQPTTSTVVDHGQNNVLFKLSPTAAPHDNSLIYNFTFAGVLQSGLVKSGYTANYFNVPLGLASGGYIINFTAYDFNLNAVIYNTSQVLNVRGPPTSGPFLVPSPGSVFGFDQYTFDFKVNNTWTAPAFPYTYTLTFASVSVASGTVQLGSTNGSFTVPQGLGSGTYSLTFVGQNSTGGVVFTASQKYSYYTSAVAGQFTYPYYLQNLSATKNYLILNNIPYSTSTPYKYTLDFESTTVLAGTLAKSYLTGYFDLPANTLSGNHTINFTVTTPNGYVVYFASQLVAVN